MMCLYRRTMLSGVALFALYAARLLAYTEDRSSPEFNRELRGYIDRVTECKSREREIFAQHHGAHE